MKKVYYFIMGIVSTLVVIGVFLFFIQKKITSVTVGSEAIAAPKELTIDRNIEMISNHQFDSIVKTFESTTIVNFWASWCSSCLKEIPRLKDYASSRGLKIVFVNFDKQTEKQNNITINKMKTLGIDKSYQLNEHGSFIDVTNIKYISDFLEKRGVAVEKIEGLPINLVYKKGKIISVFTPDDYENSINSIFDRLLFLDK